MNKIYLAILVVAVVIVGFFVVNKKKPEVKNEQNTSEYNSQIDPKNFTSIVNNPYFTLVPGTKFTYQGKVSNGTERGEFYVTSDKKIVMGVETVVVWDRIWLNGDLIEDTHDWFAQDKEGNVWYFGEDTTELEKGKILNHNGAWEAGVNGAKPGIIMKANPRVGDSYREEFFTGVAEDQADVVSVTESVTVPFGSFMNCLKTKNYTALEPNAVEHKYYCKETGNATLETNEDNERVELISVEHNAQPSANTTMQPSTQPKTTNTASTTTTPPSPPAQTPITETQAKTIALQRVPGIVIDVAIETKLGKQAYAVEIHPSDGGVETDVFVDIQTGEILAVEQ